jgi:putative transposase
LGTRKVYYELKSAIDLMGKGMGRDKFFELLRRHNLLIKRKRKYAVTTNSGHPYRRYSNELDKAQIKGANQAWVSDITYLRTRQGFVYLSLVTDRYSRKILGWHVDHCLGVAGTLEALRMALRQCKDTREVIHHSDRGIQYCCYAYTDLLKQKRMKISMGATGNCYENAIAERVNGILKDEYLLDSEFIDIWQAKQATVQAVYLYNYKRPHWSLHFKKPAEIHDAFCIQSI